MDGPRGGLRVENLYKRFGRDVAVDGVSFDIKPGEFFSLLGPSGCGKTTTLRIIGGLLTPDAGRVYLNDEDITFLPPEKRDINIVFQHYALFPHLTVYDNVAFGPRRQGWPEDRIKAEVGRLLEMVHLQGYEHKYPRELSGGEQQRVALIRALITRPQVLLLDEPLGALDLKIRQQLQLELINIQDAFHITFIYVTHDQSEALAMGDRIAVMNEGRILQIGDPRTIYENPINRFVAYFIGNTNLLEGRVAEVRPGGMARVHIPGIGDVWGMCRHHCERLRVGLDVAVSVRPEKINISRTPPSEPGYNTITGLVQDIIYLGVSIEYIIRLEQGLTLRVFQQNLADDARQVITWDEIVWLYWLPAHALVLID
ncbi:MAG: ABC transporter ATP-binding protein [Chloroflexi bacterium]|nr:ABC transporter ATP-binding protein [Chloroflexota bacterium]